MGGAGNLPAPVGGLPTGTAESARPEAWFPFRLPPGGYPSTMSETRWMAFRPDLGKGRGMG
jgi:hypothetical protein